VDGRSPNWTIWRRETPKNPSDDAAHDVFEHTHRWPGNCCSAAAPLAIRVAVTHGVSGTHLDGVHQLLGPLPRHDGNCSRPHGLSRCDVAKVMLGGESSGGSVD
jgi:hypothetical protein